MRFITSYNWQQGDSDSLVLQQARRKRGELPILLACICRDGQFAEKLAEWFHECALPCCRRGSVERMAERVQEKFTDLATEWETGRKDREIDEFALLFCAGRECFYAWRGDMGISVLNLQFDRAQARSLTWHTEEYACGRALLEENIGLLLGAGGLFKSVPRDALSSCLTVIDLNSQRQADRHLAEICYEAKRCGGANAAAVLAVVKGEV